jgi:hypothetical protein
MKSVPQPRWPVFFRFLGPACLVLVAGGCGGSKPATAPVSGTVLLDGKPVAEAAVLFEPAGGGVPARGSTDATGRFSLSTFTRGDGALPGRHRVAISKMTMAGIKADDFGLEDSSAAPASPPKSAIPRRYADPATSGLEATVEPGGANVEFSLESRE